MDLQETPEDCSSWRLGLTPRELLEPNSTQRSSSDATEEER
jgi:hypothetical protein